MPLNRKISGNDFVIGIWKIDESPEDLYNLVALPEADAARYDSFTSERRKREFLAVRCILAHLCGEIPEIKYTEWGKPSLANGSQSISISHSQEFAAVVLSRKTMGIDIESLSRNIEKVARRFLSAQELKWINRLPDAHSAEIIAWCAKEAIFKMIGHTDVEFREQITLFPFDPEKDKTFEAHFAHPAKSGKVNVNFELLENNAIVWCFNF